MFMCLWMLGCDNAWVYGCLGVRVHRLMSAWAWECMRVHGYTKKFVMCVWMAVSHQPFGRLLMHLCVTTAITYGNQDSEKQVSILGLKFVQWSGEFNLFGFVRF